MFDDAALTEDGFLGGRLRILQPKDGYRAATDPVILAAATPARPGESVLELGCGAGVASLCLAARVGELGLWGLEVQPNYADLARRNAAANGIRFTVIDGDLAAPPARLRELSVDHVIANPPYFSSGDGTPARDGGRELAQREATALSDWIGTGLRRLKPGGWLTMIQSAERLPDMLNAARTGAGSITVLPISARTGRPAGRVLFRARKGGRGNFRLLAPFVLHDGPAHVRDGDDYARRACAVLRDGAALDL